MLVKVAPILPSLISPEQSDFVHGRLIHDNILLARELLSAIRRNTKGFNLIMKLDISKTYDSLNLLALIKIMKKLVLKRDG